MTTGTNCGSATKILADEKPVTVKIKFYSPNTDPDFCRKEVLVEPWLVDGQQSRGSINSTAENTIRVEKWNVQFVAIGKEYKSTVSGLAARLVMNTIIGKASTCKKVPRVDKKNCSTVPKHELRGQHNIVLCKSKRRTDNR